MTDTTTTNGSARGRTVPALHQHTFQDTGITVGLRKVSPLLRDRLDIALRKEFPEPAVPIVHTEELGAEPNPADPDYLRARGEWLMRHAERLSERMLRYALMHAVEVEVDADAVQEVRAAMASIGVDLGDEDDKYVYLAHVAIGTQEDLQELSSAIFSRSMPTREAVEAHKATFPGDVPG